MNKLILGLLVLTTGCGFRVIDTGNRGVKVRFGNVASGSLPEGLYFYNPLTTSMVELNVQERKLEEATEVFTSDTQMVKITYAVTFYPKPDEIHTIYKQFGYDYEDKIIKQVVLGSIKDAVGQYIADELVKSREKVKLSAQKEMIDNLAARNIIVTRLDFINLDFDDGYEKAVESKVIAIQKAAEAKNKTVEVEEQSKQTVMTAKAEAEAMKIKSEALAQNKGLVQFEAVRKWDGVLPVNMYGSAPIPFLNLGNDNKKSE